MIEPKIPKQISIPSQAFEMLENEKILIDIAVILDIPKEETIKILLDYLDLNL